jgi:methenyltetrahydrofolate cyclohydrolase
MSTMGEGTSRYADLTLGGFTEALASSTPTPGGGSAAAVAASLGASLAVMVARLSVGRERYAAHEDRLERAIRQGEEARSRFLRLADEDAEAFRAYLTAIRLPRESSEERERRGAAIRESAQVAWQVPMTVVRECHRLVDAIEGLVGRSNVNAASDLDVAAVLVEAAAHGAGANVVTNLEAVDDVVAAGQVLTELEERLSSIESAAARIHEEVRSGRAGSGPGP